MKHAVKELSREMPVLVFTTEERVGMLASLLKNTQKVDQLTDAATFRECDKREEGQRFTTFLVDDPQLMRGTDWRSPAVGLALVLDKGFESQRDLQQALARTGRFGDKTVRCKTNTVELIEPVLRKRKSRMKHY